MEDIELTNGFENAVMVEGNPDRVYDAEDINTRYEGLVSSYGVYSNIESGCKVIPGAGLKVVVKKGKGEINSHWFKIETDTELQLDAADVILNRIDSVVVRRTNSSRNIVLTIKKGELATNPVPPTIVRNETIQEIFLANILVNKGSTSINTANITDVRSSNDYCGFIACLVEQLNTTELFNQYEAAQTEFITKKTNEFNTWETNQKTNFDNWFDDIKDTVSATSLYREYQAVYRSNTVNQQIIAIPTSINYVHNGLDVLNVFINGMRLLKDVEYTINSTGTQITLTTPLDVASQDVEFVNKKSVSGQAAESVVVQVEALEQQVNAIEDFNYLAKGSNDNITLSNMIQNFLNGTGDYSNVKDNASMKINVNGVLGIDTLIDEQMVFDFHSTTNSNRRVFIDFSNATITIPTSPNTTQNILAVFGCENNVIIENVNIKIGNYNASTIYGFHGGTVKNSQLIIENEDNNVEVSYGIWNGAEISDSIIKISSFGEVYGAYETRRVQNNLIYVYGSTIRKAIKSSSGFVIANDLDGSIDISTDVINLGNNTGQG